MVAPTRDARVTERAARRPGAVIGISRAGQCGVTSAHEHGAVAPAFLPPFKPADAGERDGRRAEAARAPVRLEAVWARSADEVALAQRLRYRVFVEEMGARPVPPPGTPARLDADRYDAFCEHLLVRCIGCDGRPKRVVGTYRVLLPDAARRAGSLYSDTEFDLRRLDTLRPAMAELGRSCVHPKWRSGGVILMLWAALAEFMRRNGVRYMVGCASVPMRDGGHAAASLWRGLRESHLAPQALRVRPWLALPIEGLRDDLAVETQPLIKGYLRCGAQVLGPPAWDPDFCSADLPMMLDLARLHAAYRRRFIGGADRSPVSGDDPAA